MRPLYRIIAAAAIMLATGCDGQDPDKTDIGTYPSPIERVFFAKGADISWTTRMESEGMKFYNAAGQERECTELMKDIGMNSIRLRVWVNPADGWNGKEDVLEKARRANELGMNIMIDFHYSDTWADPGHQSVPAQWAGYNVAQMASAISSHTTDVLSALKSEGIDIEWVQTGNEVNSGMLWPSGKVEGSDAMNFGSYLNAGYEAVKKIYPEAKVVLHLSNGHDAGMYTWFLDLMKKRGGKFDMVGMSLYPMWWENGGWNDWKTPVDACIANIGNVIATYGKPVMICETGARVHEPEISREIMQYILDKTRQIKGCHGVFYWEPQAPKGYNDGYEMGAFADGKPTIALDPFRN